jgi:hypothetical protein
MWRKRESSLLSSRHGNDVAALLAGAKCFVAGELLVNLPYGIGTVVADLDGGFINFIATLIAEPLEMILLAGAAFAFKDDEP